MPFGRERLRTPRAAAIAGILADLVFWPTPDGRPHFYEMD